MCNLFRFCVSEAEKYWLISSNIGISDKNPGLVSLYLKLAVGLSIVSIGPKIIVIHHSICLKNK